MLDFIFKAKLKRYYRNNNRKKKFCNLANAHTIFVLFDMLNYDEADNFIKYLKKIGKQVMVYAYADKENKLISETFPYQIIAEKETCRLFNNSLRTLAQQLKKTHFDIAIDLTLYQNISLEYLLTSVQTSMKVGLKKTHFPQYDLSITHPKGINVKELYDQLLHYLSVLK